jgi:hypothetical protein
MATAVQNNMSTYNAPMTNVLQKPTMIPGENVVTQTTVTQSVTQPMALTENKVQTLFSSINILFRDSPYFRQYLALSLVSACGWAHA